MRPCRDSRAALRPQPWTHAQIRAARMVALAPLLEKRGLALRDRGAGNLELLEYKGLIVKASYWRWPERELAGNAIDFFTHVLGVSFANAMRELMPSNTP